MNKKSIWIPVVILIIVAGGVSYWFYNQSSKQKNLENNLLNSEIIVTTDKREYSKGEPVIIIIQNNSDQKKYLSNPFYIIERFDGGKWVKIKQVICPCGAVCELVPYFILEPQETDRSNFIWDQKEEECRSAKDVYSEKLISNQVPSGEYRIKVLEGDLKSYEHKVSYSEKFFIK